MPTLAYMTLELLVKRDGVQRVFFSLFLGPGSCFETSGGCFKDRFLISS